MFSEREGVSLIEGRERERERRVRREKGDEEKRTNRFFISVSVDLCCLLPFQEYVSEAEGRSDRCCEAKMDFFARYWWGDSEAFTKEEEEEEQMEEEDDDDMIQGDDEVEDEEEEDDDEEDKGECVEEEDEKEDEIAIAGGGGWEEGSFGRQTSNLRVIPLQME